MILGAEIGMLIYGIIVLVRGRMKMSGAKEVVGAPARISGAIAMLPLPLALVFGFVYGFMKGASGGPVDVKSVQATAAGFEIITIIVCLAASLAIGYACAKPIGSAAGRPIVGQQPPLPPQDPNRPV